MRAAPGKLAAASDDVADAGGRTGDLVACAPTQGIFEAPRERHTPEYIRGERSGGPLAWIDALQRCVACIRGAPRNAGLTFPRASGAKVVEGRDRDVVARVE